MNLEDQYDRIYKYIYFHLHDADEAENLTQETFLRFLKSRTYRDENRQLRYLYTIAKNLCHQYYRDKTITFSLDEAVDSRAECFEQTILDRMLLRDALEKLSPEERELLFLHYADDVPVSVIAGMHRISRFAVYRKLKNILKKIRTEMEVNQDE